MKKYLILILCCLVTTLHAQPVITAANDATPGDNFTYIIVDSTGIVPGNSGANQTWDFSGVTPLGTTHTDEWMLPSSTPFAATFPGADIVQESDNGSGIIDYLYHTQTTTETNLQGIVTDNFGAASEMVYNDILLLRQYPTAYNNTFSDTYSGQAIMIIGPATFTIHRYGTYEYLADRYGTLITPAGTFPNTLRARIRQVFTDSVVYTGIPIPPLISYNYSTGYFWSSADAGDKLYQFSIRYDTTTTDTVTVITNSVNYQDMTTGIAEADAFKQIAKVYPVPASDVASIFIPHPESGVARLSVYDIHGVLIEERETLMPGHGDFTWKIPVAGWAQGLYFAKISCNGKSWKAMLVKS